MKRNEASQDTGLAEASHHASSEVRHSLETLVGQRVFQLACDHEDQDDADTVRSDRLLKLVCDR